MAQALEEVKEFQRDCTSCSICLNTFIKPISLPCLHTFCFQCVDDFRERKEMEGSAARCPLCRADMPQTTEELRKLPINFFINRLIELKLNSTPTKVDQWCDPCRDGPEGEKKSATMQCVECREKLCEDCVGAHRKLKISKDHELIELGPNGAQQMNEAVKRKAMSCEQHADYKLDMYCETCSTTVCVKCCMQKHKDHKSIDISEAGEKCKVELTRIIELADKKISSLSDSVEVIEQKRKAIQQTHECMQDLIEERAQAIIEEIEARKEKVLEEMEDNYKAAEISLSEISRVKKEQAVSTEAFLKLCVGLKEEGTNFELVAMSGQYREKASVLECNSQDSGTQDPDASAGFEYSFKPGTTDKNISSRVKSLFGHVNFKQNLLQRTSESSQQGASEQPTDGNIQDSTSSAKPKRRNRKGKQMQENQNENDFDDTCSVFSSVSTPRHSDDDGDECKKQVKTRINVNAKLIHAIGKPGAKPIQGIVCWNGKLYIARNATNLIDIHDAGSAAKTPERQLCVSGLTNATDMVVDVNSGCIFVGDWSTSTILKLNLKANGSADIVRLIVDGRPNGLSLSPENTLVIACTVEKKFMEYSFTGKLIREVSTGQHRPRHIVQIAHDQFIMASGDDETGFVVSRISIDVSGNMRIHRQFGGPNAPARYKLSDAKHLVVDGRTNLLYLANCKESKVIALRLGNLHVIGSSIIDETKISSPNRLTIDPATGNIYVGCQTGQLVKFSLEISEEEVTRGPWRGPGYPRGGSAPRGSGWHAPQGPGGLPPRGLARPPHRRPHGGRRGSSSRGGPRNVEPLFNT